MEESPCESKHGEGGPREWPKHPLAALAAARASCGRERGAGWSEDSNEIPKPAPLFIWDHDLGRRLRCGAETPAHRNFQPHKSGNSGPCQSQNLEMALDLCRIECSESRE